MGLFDKASAVTQTAWNYTPSSRQVFNGLTWAVGVLGFASVKIAEGVNISNSTVAPTNSTYPLPIGAVATGFVITSATVVACVTGVGCLVSCLRGKRSEDTRRILTVEQPEINDETDSRRPSKDEISPIVGIGYTADEAEKKSLLN